MRHNWVLRGYKERELHSLEHTDPSVANPLRVVWVRITGIPERNEELGLETSLLSLGGEQSIILFQKPRAVRRAKYCFRHNPSGKNVFIVNERRSLYAPTHKRHFPTIPESLLLSC